MIGGVREVREAVIRLIDFTAREAEVRERQIHGRGVIGGVRETREAVIRLIDFPAREAREAVIEREAVKFSGERGKRGCGIT